MRKIITFIIHFKFIKITAVFLTLILFGAILSSCSGSPTNPINSINPIKNSNFYIETNLQDFNVAKSTLNSQNYFTLGYVYSPFYPNGGLNAAELEQLTNCMSINSKNLDASYSTKFFLKLLNSSTGSAQNQPVLVFAPSILMFRSAPEASQFLDALKNATGANCFIKQIYNLIDIDMNNKLTLNSDSDNILTQYNPPEISILATGTVIPRTLPSSAQFNFLFAQQGRAIVYIISFENTNSMSNQLTPLMQTFLKNITTYYLNTSTT